MKGGISGRPSKKINIYVFNLYLNMNVPFSIMMKIFDMSRGTYFRYKARYYVKLELNKQPIDDDLMKEQRPLFDKYAYKIVDRYSERLWSRSEVDDYKQECLLRIWCALIRQPIPRFIQYCNSVCEAVLRDTIMTMATKHKTLFYEDYYFDGNDSANRLEKYFSKEDENEED